MRAREEKERGNWVEGMIVKTTKSGVRSNPVFKQFIARWGEVGPLCMDLALVTIEEWAPIRYSCVLNPVGISSYYYSCGMGTLAPLQNCVHSLNGHPPSMLKPGQAGAGTQVN